MRVQLTSNLKNGVAFCSRALRSTTVAAVFSQGHKNLTSAVIPRSAAATRSITRSLQAAAVVCSAGAEQNVVEVQIKVSGMVCDGCSGRVLESLQKMPGVKSVNVDLDSGLATLQIEAASQVDAFNSLPTLIGVVTELGFEAQPHFE